MGEANDEGMEVPVLECTALKVFFPFQFDWLVMHLNGVNAEVSAKITPASYLPSEDPLSTGDQEVNQSKK